MITSLFLVLSLWFYHPESGHNFFQKDSILQSDSTSSFTEYVSPEDSIAAKLNAQKALLLDNFNQRLEELREQQKVDSLRKAELEERLQSLQASDAAKKTQIERQIQQLNNVEAARISEKKARIDSLKQFVSGFPVLGVQEDTLFFIYARSGAFTPKERAETISQKIILMYEDDFFTPDSIKINQSDLGTDVLYDGLIVLSISETDALWYNENSANFGQIAAEKIKMSIIKAREDNSLLTLAGRIGLVALVLFLAWQALKLIKIAQLKVLSWLRSNADHWFHDVRYRDYTFLTAEQQKQAVYSVAQGLKWVLYALLLYISLPLLFSIFPFSRTWAEALFQLVWSPFTSLLRSIWDYIPNLFSILVIVFVMRYFIRFIRYIFHEIRDEKLEFNGFHADWAMPTYNIVRFLLYAFMLVLIFPYLPGSDSNIFKGVSVFLGLLFSLGSSSAISNMVAGLVITYMRPFKMGDRIKIGEVTGDVLEKTMLVTRIRTLKNEIVTIPNSAVLSGNTTNYSSDAVVRGLIIHTSITIGYDVPWQKVHQALKLAANRTEYLEKSPEPFVLQTELQDFYVAYQVNAFTKHAERQALIKSDLHRHILDVCNEMDIEILSPHYRANRDGNHSTIPTSYLPADYKAPSFQVEIKKSNDLDSTNK